MGSLDLLGFNTSEFGKSICFLCVFFYLLIRICFFYLVNIAFNLAYTTFVHIRRDA